MWIHIVHLILLEEWKIILIEYAKNISLHFLKMLNGLKYKKKMQIENNTKWVILIISVHVYCRFDIKPAG